MNTNITQQNIHEEVALFVEGEKYSEQEIHNIKNWFCYLRDSRNDTLPEDIEKRNAIIKMMRAFIARKKLGIPATTKQMEKEFGCF
jgi:hypothetical protein